MSLTDYVSRKRERDAHRLASVAWLIALLSWLGLGMQGIAAQRYERQRDTWREIACAADPLPIACTRGER